jgi:opacity protein-like surface antigen
MIKYSNGTKMVVSKVVAVDTVVQKKKVINVNKYFRKDKSYISAGYGFGAYINYYYTNSLYSTNYNRYGSLENVKGKLTGPFYLKYEYAVSEEWSIGINLSYVEDKFDYDYNTYSNYSGTYVTYKETAHFTSFSGLLHANLHFGDLEKFDPYFGFGAGYRSGNWDYTSNDPQFTTTHSSTDFPFGFETTIGVRIKIAQSLSAYTEAGIAKSVIQFGITAGF